MSSVSLIDLRSDLLSQPTEAALEAMYAAARRPGAFGLREDPAQRELERRSATLLGKEDALLSRPARWRTRPRSCCWGTQAKSC